MSGPKANAMPSHAVILAAGLGSRLGTMTSRVPKCMIDIGGRTLLDRALENLEKCGVETATIVTGYKHEVIEAQNEALRRERRIRCDFVHNADFARTNNIYSLWIARAHISRDFFLLESDIVFGHGFLNQIVPPCCAAVSPLKEVMDGTVLTVNDDSYVNGVYLKSDARPAAPLLKTINIYSLTVDAWSDCLLPRLDAAVRQGITDIYYEAVFAAAIRSGELRMRTHSFASDEWCEIDTPADYERACDML